MNLPEYPHRPCSPNLDTRKRENMAAIIHGCIFRRGTIKQAIGTCARTNSRYELFMTFPFDSRQMFRARLLVWCARRVIAGSLLSSFRLRCHSRLNHHHHPRRRKTTSFESGTYLLPTSSRRRRRRLK